MLEANRSEAAREEPHGMQDEAQLLTHFAEIPGISSAWIGDAGHNGHQITVSSLPQQLMKNAHLEILSKPQESLTQI